MSLGPSVRYMPRCSYLNSGCLRHWNYSAPSPGPATKVVKTF